MSVKYCLPVSSRLLLAKTVTHPAARSLCDSWASCYSAQRLYIYLHGKKPALSRFLKALKISTYRIYR